MTDTVREIAFDTETTGLEWDKDDRIIDRGRHVPLFAIRNLTHGAAKDLA